MMAQLIEFPLPPHDLGAEDAVLSAMLSDCDALETARRLLKPEHFYSPANRWIFLACMAQAEEGLPVDLVTVGSWLREHNRMAEIGGVPYLAKIIDSGGFQESCRAWATYCDWTA
jgi:replicative DNA helicase